MLLADRACDSDGLRRDLKRRGACLYRLRNVVKGFFNELKHFDAISTRYDKRDVDFLASIQLASIHIWLLAYVDLR